MPGFFFSNKDNIKLWKQRRKTLFYLVKWGFDEKFLYNLEPNEFNNYVQELVEHNKQEKESMEQAKRSAKSRSGGGKSPKTFGGSL